MSQIDLFASAPALAWTKETPTLPGHYLYWSVYEGRRPTDLICTTRFGADMKNYQGRSPADYQTSPWWYGPIALPVEEVQP